MKNKYIISQNSIFTEKVDTYIFCVPQDDTLQFLETHLSELKKQYPHLDTLLKKRNFTGKASEIIALPMHLTSGHETAIIVGVGKGENYIENYRRAIATAIRASFSYQSESIALSINPMNNEDYLYLLKEIVIIIEMTAYKFDDFLTHKDKQKKYFHSIVISVSVNNSIDVIKKNIQEGQIVGEAVNKARYLVDMPPSHMTPKAVATYTKEMVAHDDIQYTVYNYEKIKELKMGGLHAVARGSVEEPQFVKLEYKPNNANNKKPILLVGKGITFDSGGLSIKPANAMETMKDDMAGAAAVILATSAISKLKLPLHVIALAPLTENMPSGHATKPGDVITFYSGKTAEVKNTDAEGRLILADALSYGIKNYKPEIVIDLATLTGACAHALGPFYTGLFSNNTTLAEKVIAAGKISGDHVWQLPMGEDYKKAIKSNIADICNIGSGQVKAGGTTAAHFLEHFVDNTPWVHLDIAGSAFDVPGIPYYLPGATGVGVRLLVEFLKKYQNL